MRLQRLAMILLLFTALIGCGQKGALYRDAGPEQAPAAAAEPADRDGRQR
ncbi:MULTISPECIES: LPS translocon maturation chaperone LptM [Marinobacter]|nr:MULTISPECIES: lipoprotein [Marinobacter]MCG8519062.1 lipoprotein [Pseudomonadales bacterium]MCK7567843.1 lipoprotein [Marinobacter xestospongiae]UDL05448.1 lipoprotein [Marinobacter sp. CA1]